MVAARRVTLTLASFAATVWAAAIVQLGAALWSGALPTPLDAERRVVAGAFVVALGQLVFLLSVADRVFPRAARGVRNGVLWAVLAVMCVTGPWFLVAVVAGGW